MDLITDKDVQGVQKQNKQDELLYYLDWIDKQINGLVDGIPF
jgi:hypothetical protein